ncbi:MAG TPA: hypothetical protein VFH55_06200 [Nitrospiria bacterium]|nr:hypothetical protein [Nitrospiria bacterium]
MEDFNRHSPGKLHIGLFLFLALLAGGVYQGFQLAPYWMNAYEMKDFMVETAHTGQLASDEAIRRSIIAKAKDLGIELTDRDIEIHRSPTDLSISTGWDLDYNFFGLYAHTFTFTPEVNVKYQ